MHNLQRTLILAQLLGNNYNKRMLTRFGDAAQVFKC